MGKEVISQNVMCRQDGRMRGSMEQCRFSIIVVCYNAGDKLEKTINSILAQDYGSYEIVVQDGCSSDGSVEKLQKEQEGNGKLHICIEKDKGIYDAMNKALAKAKGQTVHFLNCGDTFPSPDILKKAAAFMDKYPNAGIWYGDIFNEKTSSTVASAPQITPFVCYRNIPCHQACFYEKRLFEKRQYDISYVVRADYEHFLWSCLQEGVAPVYLGMVIAAYEGGGFSESRENRKLDKKEHKEITRTYLGKKRCIWYGFLLAVTLAPLRRVLAESPVFSKWYNKVKAGVYK